MGRLLAIAVPQRTQRPLFVERFADGSGFAFNAEEPSGVKYLSAGSFDLLMELIGIHGNPPHIRQESDNSSVSQLLRHGLVSRQGINEPPVSPKKTRTLSVWFHIANACNLSCSYCYIPHLKKAATDSQIPEHLMSLGTASAAVRSLFDYCRADGIGQLQIKFAGGEPTLNPSVIEQSCALAERLADEYGVDVTFRILTNGVFDTVALLPIFTRYRIGVSISVDGDPESHDRVRFMLSRSALSHPAFQRLDSLTEAPHQRRGSWSCIASNIDRLLEEGLKPYLLCTVTSQNSMGLSELVAFCLGKRIGFRFSPIRDTASFGIPGIQQRLARELGDIYKWIGDNYPPSMPIERFARFAEWNLHVRKDIACGTCRSMIAIDQRGSVSSCQMRMSIHHGDCVVGDIVGAVNAIRLAPENKYLVAPNGKTGECASCLWRYACAGGCPEHTRAVRGTVNTASPWCELYMNLFPQYLRAVASQLKRGIDQQHQTARDDPSGQSMGAREARVATRFCGSVVQLNHLCSKEGDGIQ